jgi:hypothetical protein
VRFALVVLGLALAMVWVAQSSGKDPVVSTGVVRDFVVHPDPAPIACEAGRKAVVFYRGKTWHWQSQRFDMTRQAGRKPTIRGKDCRYVRYALHEWKTRARLARTHLRSWQRYQYAWWQWLPSKWQRIGACETGYGRRPGNWQHNSGAYQGAFGFAVSSWDSFVPRADPRAGPYPSEAYEGTPRQQYEVALAIYRAYGLSGWGCRNA